MLEDLCRLKAFLDHCPIFAGHHIGDQFWIIGPSCHNLFQRILLPIPNLHRAWTEELLQHRSINCSTGSLMLRRLKPLKLTRDGDSQIIAQCRIVLCRGLLFRRVRGLFPSISAKTRDPSFASVIATIAEEIDLVQRYFVFIIKCY